MEQETIAQTMLDQLVTDENSQMLKALIPILSFSGQRILLHTPKHRNCVTHFSYFPATERYADLQFQANEPNGTVK